VHQISRQLDNPFVFYGNFHTLMKRRREKKKEKKLKYEVMMLAGISSAKIV